jgi:hypothetical protein
MWRQKMKKANKTPRQDKYASRKNILSTKAQRQKLDYELEQVSVVTSPVGVKFDHGKTRYDLYTQEALDQIGQVLTYGAAKYADRNWEKGIPYGRVFAAIMRHLWAWWGGEKNDPESGLNHLAHAGCNIVFLLTFEKRNMAGEWDERNKGI